MSSAISQFLSASEFALQQSSRVSVLWRLPNDQLLYLLTDGLFDLNSLCRLDTSITNKELRSHFLALIRCFLSSTTSQMGRSLLFDGYVRSIFSDPYAATHKSEIVIFYFRVSLFDLVF